MLKQVGKNLRYIIVGFIEVGGYTEFVNRYHGGIPESLIFSNNSCKMPLDDAFNIFRDPLSSDLPWPGALTGATLKSFWYWCADQVCKLTLFKSKVVVSFL